MIKYSPPEITDDVPFPAFAQGIGWALTVLVLCPIPITFLYKLWKSKGDLMERLKDITTPAADWGPNDGSDRQQLQPDTFHMDTKFGIDGPMSNGNHM